MITYPVDVVNTRWAVYQVSTGQVIGRNKKWPVLDGSEIPGQDPDFVYLLHINDAQPDYDARLYFLNGNETVDVSANEIRLSWTANRRPLEERIVAAENVEADEMTKHISLEREAMETRLMVSAILNYISGLQMPPKVQAMADAYKAKGIKLWKNRDRLNAIITAIESNQDPDLDTGWEQP